jgi:hypothetical protein
MVITESSCVHYQEQRHYLDIMVRCDLYWAWLSNKYPYWVLTVITVQYWSFQSYSKMDITVHDLTLLESKCIFCHGNMFIFNLQEKKMNSRIVESLQSHMILTMSHWSSGLTCLLHATRVTGSIPLGRLTWNRDSPVSIVSLQVQRKRMPFWFILLLTSVVSAGQYIHAIVLVIVMM